MHSLWSPLKRHASGRVIYYRLSAAWVRSKSRRPNRDPLWREQPRSNEDFTSGWAPRPSPQRDQNVSVTETLLPTNSGPSNSTWQPPRHESSILDNSPPSSYSDPSSSRASQVSPQHEPTYLDSRTFLSEDSSSSSADRDSPFRQWNDPNKQANSPPDSTPSWAARPLPGHEWTKSDGEAASTRRSNQKIFSEGSRKNYSPLDPWRPKGRTRKMPPSETSNRRDVWNSPKPEGRPPAEVGRPTEAQRAKAERNRLFRNAFREQSHEIDAAVTRKLSSPFVPTIRNYPFESATRQNLAEARRAARVQVAFDILEHYLAFKQHHWSEVQSLLKRMTPQLKNLPPMAALRIVMPASMEMDLKGETLEVFNSVTRLVERIRIGVDNKNPSAIVIRGQASVLAKAAESLIDSYKDVKVFQLGEVGATDYQTKLLWPIIEKAPFRGDIVPMSESETLWVHEEPKPYWITTPYESTPKPERWTGPKLLDYVTILVSGRLKPHLAVPFYGKESRLVDTTGVRVGLLLEVLEDRTTKRFLTPRILQLALGFMTQQGGYRASAERLFRYAEEVGVPIDVEVFNIMLAGYVTKKDGGFFYHTLKKMEMRLHYANIRTWMHFLTLTQQDKKRMELVGTMNKLGLLAVQSNRRAVAEVMTGLEAHRAFSAGKTVDQFLAQQTRKLGPDWLGVSALNSILKEFFRFHDKYHEKFEDFKPLLDDRPSDLPKITTETINIILDNCCSTRDWPTALWALDRMELFGVEPDEHTYQLLVILSCNARSPACLGVVFFYGCLERKLRRYARLTLQKVLLRKHPQEFWNEVQPKLFSREMAEMLEKNPADIRTGAVSAAEWAILSVCDNYMPDSSLVMSLGKAFHDLDRPFHRARMGAHYTADSSEQDSDFCIHLNDSLGQRPPMVVRLTEQFVPETMVMGDLEAQQRATLEDDEPKYSPMTEELPSKRKKRRPANALEAPWEHADFKLADLPTDDLLSENYLSSNCPTNGQASCDAPADETLIEKLQADDPQADKFSTSDAKADRIRTYEFDSDDDDPLDIGPSNPTS